MNSSGPAPPYDSVGHDKLTLTRDKNGYYNILVSTVLGGDTRFWMPRRDLHGLIVSLNGRSVAGATHQQVIEWITDSASRVDLVYRAMEPPPYDDGPPAG